MEWFIAAVAVVALGVAAVVAAGGGGSMAKDPVRDTYAMAVPEGPLDAATVRELRFGVALRGYAMGQVDEVLDRLAAELAVLHLGPYFTGEGSFQVFTHPAGSRLVCTEVFSLPGGAEGLLRPVLPLMRRGFSASLGSLAEIVEVPSGTERPAAA